MGVRVITPAAGPPLSDDLSPPPPHAEEPRPLPRPGLPVPLFFTPGVATDSGPRADDEAGTAPAAPPPQPCGPASTTSGPTWSWNFTKLSRNICASFEAAAS